MTFAIGDKIVQKNVRIQKELLLLLNLGFSSFFSTIQRTIIFIAIM